MSTPIRHQLLWTYNSPSNLYLVPPHPKLTLDQVVTDYIHRELHLNPANHVLASLASGQPCGPSLGVGRLTEIVLCLPRKQVNILVEQQGCGHTGSFSITADPTESVYQLKNKICQQRGYPVSQQELIFRNQPMLNERPLFEHNVRPKGKLSLLLQPTRPFAIRVEPFWGVACEMEVSAYSTAGQVLTYVLGKAGVAVDETPGSFPMLVCYGDKTLDNTMCLNYYGVEQGSQLRIATSVTGSNSHCTINADYEETRTNIAINVLERETWLVVALKLHAITGTLVSRMKLIADLGPVDLSSTIAELKYRTGSEVRVRVVTARGTFGKPNAGDKVTVHCCLPSGVTHPVVCSKRCTVNDVKKALEEQYGIADAQAYQVSRDNSVLPPCGTSIQVLKRPDHSKLELHLPKYKVTASHGGHHVPLVLFPTEKLSAAFQKVKTIFALRTLTMVYCGTILSPDETVEDALLHMGSRIFVEADSQSKIVHLVVNGSVIPLTGHSLSNESLGIQQLTNRGVDTVHFYDCLQLFLAWRFPKHTKSIIAQPRSRRPSGLRSSSSVGGKAPTKRRQDARVQNQELRPKFRGYDLQCRNDFSNKNDLNKGKDLYILYKSALRPTHKPLRQDSPSSKSGHTTPLKSALSHRTNPGPAKRQLSVTFDIPSREASVEEKVQRWTTNGWQKASPAYRAWLSDSHTQCLQHSKPEPLPAVEMPSCNRPSLASAPDVSRAKHRTKQLC